MTDTRNFNDGNKGIYAYLDECGAYGFDKIKQQNSPLFIIVAIIVKVSDIKIIEERLQCVRNENFGGNEIKSHNIRGNHKRRAKIIDKLNDLPFSIFALIVDKRTVFADHGIKKSKKTFYKFLNEKVYEELRSTYPYLSIVTDEVGGNDYIQEFTNYVRTHRKPLTLFDEENFNVVDSKSTNAVQLADLIAGTLSYIYDEDKKKSVPANINFFNLINNKIAKIKFFPQSYDNSLFEHEDGSPEYNKNIVQVAYRKALDFIQKNKNKDDDDIRRQVFVLEYLLFRYRYNSYRKYIQTRELMGSLERNNFPKISEQVFRNKVIGKLRDNGVIISSSSKGYKLPSSEKEICDYYNHVSGVVIPMIHRLNLCNESLKMADGDKIDYLDKECFIGLKKLTSTYQEILHNSND